MMKKAGLCSVTFRNLDVSEIIKLTKENGLSAIEWGSDIHVSETDLKNAETVGKRTREAGLECPSYGSYFRCGEKENFENFSLAAEKLGATTIRVWAGTKNAEEWTKEEYERFIKRVQDYSEIAKSRGQTIAFEFHHGTYNDDAEHSLKLLEDVGRENVKTYWQPMYWKKLCGREDEENNLRSLRLLKKKIENVHVYYWTGYERKALSEGEKEWKRYISEIGDSRYYLEFVKDDDVQNFREDGKILSKLIKRGGL